MRKMRKIGARIGLVAMLLGELSGVVEASEVVGIRADESMVPSTVMAANGVPVTNIGRPDEGGTSLNGFTEYGNDARGNVLNNIVDPMGQSVLAGMIAGNPKLGGVAAKLIIVEVRGGMRVY